MEKITALVLMAGLSTRFGDQENKQLCYLNGKPVFSYSVMTFANAKSINNLILIVNKAIKNEVEKFINENKISATIVLGGKTRQESVENGLKFVSANNDDIIVIHDSARPFVDEKNINEVIKGAKKYGASTTYLPSVNTIAKMNAKGEVESFIDRSTIANIQTPQAFKFAVLKNAHKLATDDKATDDCSLVLKMKGSVKLILGSEKLHKITTKNDVKYLEAISK